MNARYTEIVKYEKSVIGEKSVLLDIPPTWVPTPFPASPLWQRMGSVFTHEQYLYSCPPVDCGVVSLNIPEPSTKPLRVLRCPIKKPGTRTFIVPAEVKDFMSLIQHIAELDQTNNGDFEASWAHITIERTFIEAGETQRVPGWHVDGFQGVRAPRHAIEHSYLWSDSLAFETCIQPFFLNHLDPARHNIFDEITRQAKETNTYAGFPEHIYLIDPYVVHRSPVMPKSGWRTIVRITFTTTELEDPVNTVNASLGLQQSYPARIDVRDRLYTYQGPLPWALYAVKNASKVD